VHQEAVLKLKNEIEQNKNNPYVQVVGSFLLGHLEGNFQAAEKIMTTDKTIAKSLDAMRTEASKKKVGNCAMFTPEEGFAIVLKYFGIDSAVNIQATSATLTVKVQRPVTDQKQKSKVDFDVNLDDFI